MAPLALALAAMTITTQAPIYKHATANDTRRNSRFGPRVRRLHSRIGQAHHQAEGMGFSRALLEGQATPLQLQLAALLRALAHAYVRYGGDLSGGQQLAHQANAIMAALDLPALSFWSFSRPSIDLKEALHGGIERLLLSAKGEEELMDEAQAAFGASQALLAELESLA
jgi:heme oxygenase